MDFRFSKNFVYKTKCYLYNYNGSDFRIVRIKASREKGFEDTIKRKSDAFIDYNSDEVRRVSESRTRRNIREIALCNDFEYFATITINSEKADRYSLDNCQQLLKKGLKKIKRNDNEFAYIFITEKHKDGAFHFHGLVKNFPKDDLYSNNFGYISSHIFDNLCGFNSFSLIKNYSACCNYITKYITKDCVRNSHNQVYIASRGLKKATREELINNFEFSPTFSNDFCEIQDFNFDKLSYDEKIKIFNKINEGIC